jgi:hypothetical protein
MNVNSITNFVKQTIFKGLNKNNQTLNYVTNVKRRERHWKKKLKDIQAFRKHFNEELDLKEKMMKESLKNSEKLNTN